MRKLFIVVAVLCMLAAPAMAGTDEIVSAHILGVPLFDPEETRFAATSANAEKLDSLLPQRVRSQKAEIDDDF